MILKRLNCSSYITFVSLKKLLAKIIVMEREFMRRLIMVVLIVLLAVPAFAAETPTIEDQKVLYSIGVVIAKQLDVFNLSAKELEFVKQGIADSASGRQLVVEPEVRLPNINGRDLILSRYTQPDQDQKLLLHHLGLLLPKQPTPRITVNTIAAPAPMM